MQPCNRICYSNVYWRLNIFRAVHRSSRPTHFRTESGWTQPSHPAWSWYHTRSRDYL